MVIVLYHILHFLCIVLRIKYRLQFFFVPEDCKSRTVPYLCLFSHIGTLNFEAVQWDMLAPMMLRDHHLELRELGLCTAFKFQNPLCGACLHLLTVHDELSV